MKRADKLLRYFGRSLMTDKLLACLVLLVLLGIIIIIVVKMFGIRVSGDVTQGVLVIDCSLEWSRNFKECQQANTATP